MGNLHSPKQVDGICCGIWDLKSLESYAYLPDYTNYICLDWQSLDQRATSLQRSRSTCPHSANFQVPSPCKATPMASNFLPHCLTGATIYILLKQSCSFVCPTFLPPQRQLYLDLALKIWSVSSLHELLSGGWATLPQLFAYERRLVYCCFAPLAHNFSPRALSACVLVLSWCIPSSQAILLQRFHLTIAVNKPDVLDLLR